MNKYRDALNSLKDKKNNVACDLFVQLSEEQNFGLKSLSLARAFSVCSGENSSAEAKRLPSIENFLKLSFPTWMGDMQLRSAMARSQNLNDDLSEYKISVQILNDSIKNKAAPDSEKEKLVRRCQNILSAHLNDENYISIANVEQLNEKLYYFAPRFLPNPPKEKLWAVAKDFEKAKLDFKHAQQFFNKLYDLIEMQPTKTAKDLDLEYRALDSLRYDYKLERSADHKGLFDAARRATDFSLKYLKQKGKTSVWPANYLKSSLLYAGHLWTFTSSDGSTKLAIKVLEDAMATLKPIKGEAYIDDLVLMRARIADEQGDPELTLKLLQNLGKETSEDDKRDQMRWTRAFLFYKRQQYEDAAQAFKDMIPDSPTEHNARAHFWKAESLKKLAEKENSTSNLIKGLNPSLLDFQWLVENEPFGYYGLVASHELNMALPSIESVRKAQHEKKKTDDQASAPPSPFDSAELFEMSQLLIAAKETEFERKLLDQTSYKMSKVTSTSTQNWIDLLKLYAQAEQYQNLFESLTGMPTQIRNQVFADNPELVFPTEPYTALVQTVASQLGLRWEFVFSIMRQESSLNPMARSPANAFGLLQMIPENALEVAKDVNIHLDSYKDAKGHLQLVNPEILFDPDVNIHLGAALMKRLFKKNQNNFIKTVAGYNSSPNAVEGWIRSRYHGDILAFIEDIPYEETKTYIKTVMRNFIYYTRLETPASNVEFPSWCLEGFPLVSQ